MIVKIGDEVWIRATVDGKPSKSGSISIKSGPKGREKLWVRPEDVIIVIDGRTFSVTKSVDK
jgi:hypothetical protein